MGPALLGLGAESDRSLDASRAVLEVPVAARQGAAGQVDAGGHVGAGELGQRLDEGGALLTRGEIAAVEQEIRAVREGVSDGERVVLQGSGTTTQQFDFRQAFRQFGNLGGGGGGRGDGGGRRRDGGGGGGGGGGRGGG